MHRFVLHNFDLPFWREHVKHHRHPTAPTGVPYVIVMVLSIISMIVAALVDFSVLFVTGVVLGYVLYVTTHEALHAREYQRGPFAWLQSMHNTHHRNWRGNYGVTTPLWDIVFRTTH